LFIKTSLNRLRGKSILDPKAAVAEQLFLAPPFTESVVAAIRLISTRLALEADEASRRLWQQESNAASEAEYEALLPLLEKLEKPKRVLEIGPGFGRSVVFLSKKGLFAGSEISLYDGNGTSTRYKQKYYEHPPKWPDISSFCGNLSLLESMLNYNGMKQYQIFDAAQTPLAALPGPYDLIYGFYSIGFHWSLEYYLDELEALLHDRTLLVCTLNKNFRRFSRLEQFSTRVLECREVKKNAAPLRLLVLSKGDLPEVGQSLAEAFPR
jgi:Methyltransferase domain